MKTIILTSLLLLTGLFMVGCESDPKEILVEVDEIPLPPQGVYSVTGDEQVFVYWNGTHDEDVAGYFVYRSFDPVNGYIQIGVVTQVFDTVNFLDRYRFVDNNVSNGITYYYAVTSYDYAGQESLDLSYEEVGDTPRPEGLVTLYDMAVAPDSSGLEMDTTMWITNFNDPAVDIYIDSYLGEFNINAKDTGVYLQDMGYADSFDSISVAPNTFEGWSQYGWSELIIGHIYVVWDADGFFAKLRVIEINYGLSRVTFEWAFQLDPNNPQLVKPIFDDPKPSLTKNYNAKRPVSNEK